MSSAASPCKPFIRPCTEADVTALAATMREDDRLECWHSSRTLPEDALSRGYRASCSPFAIERGGEVVAIFGVVGTVGLAGSPWMLGAPALVNCRSLLRECRQRLDAYTEEYRYLTNACWARNEVHIEWIKWLGFTFNGSELRNGETFLHFHRSANV